MPPRLAATARRVDGTPVLRVDVPFLYDLDRAATTLAALFAREPLRTGIHALVDGLTAAVQDPRLRDPAYLHEHAHPNGVAAYRRRLVELNVFPTPEVRAAMLEELRQAQASERGSGERTPPAVGAVQTRQPRLWSKHERDDGEPVVRVECSHFFDLDEVATVLALLHPGETRFSQRLVRGALQQATADGLLQRRHRVAAADPTIVQAYRTRLTEADIFPRDGDEGA